MVMSRGFVVENFFYAPTSVIHRELILNEGAQRAMSMSSQLAFNCQLGLHADLVFRMVRYLLAKQTGPFPPTIITP